MTPPAPISFEVRLTQPEDVPALAKLAAAMVQLHHEMDRDRFMTRDGVEQGYARWLVHEINNPKSIVLAALAARSGSESKTVVGYAYGGLVERDWMVLREPCGMIHDLMVSPDWQRQGVGRELVRVMIEKLAGLGTPRIALHTAWQNGSARTFFEKIGFRATMLEMMRASTPHV